LDGLIRRFCLSQSLVTYDPYDIWKTELGFRVKHFYNSHRRLGLPGAGLFAVFDLLNNGRRLFYTPSEFAVVRAHAVLCLLNLYQQTGETFLIDCARSHLEWLLAHSCEGYSGPCWGLGFRHAVSKHLVYGADMPLSVMTPYALEAFMQFTRLSRDDRFLPAIHGIFRFFERDVRVMKENAEELATSYAPFEDRIVVNAVSYCMYARALSLPHLGAPQSVETMRVVQKIYAYIRGQQHDSGAWWYSPDTGSFIDCFHSCILLKNVFKTKQLVPLEGADALLRRGYEYLVRTFLDKEAFLFRRFSVANKPGLTRFDLYDSAEALQIAMLLGDWDLADRLLGSVIAHFCDGTDVYSQIDIFGMRRSKNTLRWAVMPFLYSASCFLIHAPDRHPTTERSTVFCPRLSTLN
jgi:hypothetical protein